MKVTQEMEEAYVRAAYASGEQVTAAVHAGLQAVLDLIDVPPSTVDIRITPDELGGIFGPTVLITHMTAPGVKYPVPAYGIEVERIR